MMNKARMEKNIPNLSSLNPMYLKEDVKVRRIHEIEGAYVSDGQIIPSLSRSKNATCFCSGVFCFPDSYPVPSAVLGPSFGATIFLVLVVV